MKMLVLGGGLQGSACAYDLLRSGSVESVTIADIAPDKLPAWLVKAGGSRLKAVRLDATDEAAALALMKGHQSVMSALPYYFNGTMARLAVEAGCNFADLGGNTEIVMEQKKLDGAAKARNVSVIHSALRPVASEAPVSVITIGFLLKARISSMVALKIASKDR